MRATCAVFPKSMNALAEHENAGAARLRVCPTTQASALQAARPAPAPRAEAPTHRIAVTGDVALERTDPPGSAPCGLPVSGAALVCGAMRVEGRGMSPPRVASRTCPREGQAAVPCEGKTGAGAGVVGERPFPRAASWPGPRARRVFRVDSAFRVGVDGTGAALNLWRGAAQAGAVGAYRAGRRGAGRRADLRR